MAPTDKVILNFNSDGRLGMIVKPESDKQLGDPAFSPTGYTQVIIDKSDYESVVGQEQLISAIWPKLQADYSDLVVTIEAREQQEVDSKVAKEQARQQRITDGFISDWIPSSPELVDAMLDLAGVTPRDTVFDLGCGDGRVLVAAGQRGARVVGIELDGDLISQAQSAVSQLSRVSLIQEDMSNSNLSKATIIIVTVENIQSMEAKLKGARVPVVAYYGDFSSWSPTQETIVGHERIRLWE